MVFKFVALFFTLMLLIFGIYKACDMEDELDRNVEEFEPLTIIGGILTVVGFIIGIIATFAKAHGVPGQLSATFIIGGMTMFIEPFIHYLVIKDKR